jgi:hypothetical protein
MIVVRASCYPGGVLAPLSVNTLPGDLVQPGAAHERRSVGQPAGLAEGKVSKEAIKVGLKEETIMRPQDQIRPADLVKKMNEEFPHFKTRLSKPGDPELSSVLINFYPESTQSRTSMLPEPKEQQPSTLLLRTLKKHPWLVNGHTQGKLLGQRRGKKPKGVVMVPEDGDRHRS